MTVDPGCTSCGSPDTVTVDGVHGRRCGNCPPGFSPTHLVGLHDDRRDVGAYISSVPSGGFRADFAADMVDMGRPDAAFAYLGAWLARETDARFARAGMPPIVVGKLTSGTITADIVLSVALHCFCTEHDDPAVTGRG